MRCLIHDELSSSKPMVVEDKVDSVRPSFSRRGCLLAWARSLPVEPRSLFRWAWCLLLEAWSLLGWAWSLPVEAWSLLRWADSLLGEGLNWPSLFDCDLEVQSILTLSVFILRCQS